MAEKITLLELDLDIDKLTKASVTSQRRIEELKLELSSLRKEQRNGLQETNGLTASLNSLQKQGKGNSKEAKVLSNNYKNLTSKIINQSKTINTLDIEYKNISAEHKRQITLINSYNKSVSKQLTGMDKLKQEIKESKIAYYALTEEQKKNHLIGGRLRKQIVSKDKEFKKLNKSLSSSTGLWSKLKNSFIGFVGVMSAAQIFKNAKNIVAGFELQIATLKGISKATNQELKEMREQALELGRSTEYTAKQVAQLQTEYARLGFVPKQIREMAEATLFAATAMDSELGESAKLVGATLNSFGKSAAEAAEISDKLAFSTQTSALDFSKLSTAIPIVATTADKAGVSLDRMIATLGKLSDRGFDASTSATALRNIYLELSKKGITYAQAMNQIRDATDKNKKAFELFGKRGATVGVILSEVGMEIDELTQKLGEDSFGSAQDLANEKINTLDGSLKLLNSAWEGFILQVNDGTGASNFFTKAIKFLANNLNDLLSVVGIIITTIGVYKVATIAASGATKGFAAAKILLSSNTRKAAISMKLFNRVTKLNPIGAIASLVAFAATTFLTYKSVLASTTEAQDDLNVKTKENNSELLSNKNRLEALVNVAKNEKASKEARLNAIKELNEISPEHLGNISLETINTKKATKAINSYVQSLENKFKVERFLNQKIDLQEKLEKLKESFENTEKAVKKAESLSQTPIARLTQGEKMQLQLAEAVKKDYQNTLSEITLLENNIKKIDTKITNIKEKELGGGKTQNREITKAKLTP